MLTDMRWAADSGDHHGCGALNGTAMERKHCSAQRSIGRSFPLKGFADLDDARQWAMRLVQWSDHGHRHSGIRYVTPEQRHTGQDGPVLAARHAVYQDARQRNPQRWSGPTRNWTPVGGVTLNPERNIIIRAATSQIQLSGLIGEPAFPSPDLAAPP